MIESEHLLLTSYQEMIIDNIRFENVLLNAPVGAGGDLTRSVL